jgi:RNA polymerase sigma factor (TIGR02999 family)
MSRSNNITEILDELRASGGATPEARNRLYDAVYEELKKVANGLMRSERPGHTLQPTALVNEAYLKIFGRSETEWRDRKHFLGVATRAMRQVLVDHARRRSADKRGGGWDRITFNNAITSTNHPETGILELDRALDRLAELSQRMVRVVEFRVFGGLSHDEIADMLSVSSRTAANDWSVARRWLARELAGRSLA